jgi:hypothetical protein
VVGFIMGWRLRNSGNMDYQNRGLRGLPYGLRRSPYHILDDDEIKSIKADISAIMADEDVFIFNDKRFSGTAYVSALDIISVKGNVLPGIDSLHPRDIMSARAVLAHEYYGHRAYRYTELKVGDWRDEFRASYMAARNSPGLSDKDRKHLVLDACERAKEAGVDVRNNSFMKEVLYGKSE